MTVRVDPEQNETRALFSFVDLDGRRVLEIGCGDGRLTWRYADDAARVIAIDPDPARLARAVAACPPRLRNRVEFRLEPLQSFTSGAGFDLVILAWSL
jgi:cyclopropane fatty-acyl-phospholipid synthase-like methyltransferase